ncbi:E3 ubiquitin protein ligase TRIP12 [Echinococcus multilocularis]|uniref:E3 ubiquitin-protein ligase n=1 Tax=Echinococcus multilocularis TaxID=6211 RepID=A0A087VYK2_ECHMU|nr:E3 ubiquitin protein ligase TRIP12 [Echinococcus multilocularis]
MFESNSVISWLLNAPLRAQLHHGASEQRKPSTRLNPLSIHFNREKVKAAISETEPPRETHFIFKQFELSASDLSSESSLIETPRSSEQASSSISTSTLTDVVHYSKRRRLQTEVDTFDSYSSYHRHSHFTSCAPGLEEFFGLDHQKYPRDHIFQTFEQGSARPSLETILPTEFPHRGKTGSCNSKRLRGKGYVGGSSTEDIFSDQNQQADAGLFSSTAHQKDIEMPADQGEQTQRTPVTKVLIRGSRGQEDTDAPSGSGGSSWFRSFTCFANNDEDEQVAIDLSGGSNQVNKTNPHASVSTPSGPPGAYLPDGLVFSNPVPSAALHDLPGSSACSGGILRCVSSLSASISSSASSRLRPHRGPPLGRHDSSKRSIPGPSGGRSAGRSSQTSSGNGVYIQHHHRHHVQTSTEQQQQPQHQQQQGSGINYRILQLKLASGDVASQLVLLQEINQALLMGSEESLAGLAVHDLVSAIVDLLDSEKSLASLPDEEVVELKNLSCNILAHLMDVMPKAADAVVMAVPLLLNTMSCSFVGDILERIINVLEQVSRRNGRQVLLYGGVTTVMGYYDFVTVAQHRTILSMVANCFADVRRDDFFTHIAGCLPSLCERLACEGPGSSTEPRCVERVCLCFARLIEAFKGEPEKLREIASFGLCQHLKHLMTASPPIVSNMKDIAYMLATLCTYCPDLAVDILTMGYAEAIYTLLTDQKPHEMTFHLPGPKTHMTGPRCTSSRTNIARCLENRGVENVYAIIHLISAMLPPIQDNGVILCPPTIFTSRTPTSTAKTTDVRTVLFQQQCKAFEDIVSRGKRKTIVDDSEKTRGDADANAGFSKSNNLVLVRTVHLLLPMLLDLYTELNSTSPRMKCIEAIQRIVYNASPFVLSWMVSPRSVSAMVADMLGSPEFALIAAGLQLANLFIARIPQVFAIYFRKEGVLFHLQRLSSLASENNKKDDGSGAEESETPSSSEANKQVLFTPLTAALQASPTISSASLAPPQHPRSSSHWISGVLPTLSSAVADQSAPSRLRLRSQRNGHRSTMEGSSCPKPPHFIFVPGLPGPNLCDMNVLEPSAQAALESSISSSSSSSSTLDIDLNAEAAQASPSATATSDVAGSCHDSNLHAWITGQCQDLYDRIKALVGNPPRSDTLASKALAGSGSGAVGDRKATRRHSSSSPTLQTPQGVIPRDLVPELEALSHQLMAADEPAAWVTGLTRLASLLTQTILSEDEAPSPFEVQQSGLLDSLHAFLTQPTERRLRLFLLLRLFVGPQYTENINLKKIVEKPKILAQAKSALQSLKHQNNERSVYELAFPMLITCLLDCLHQQEHFQVVTGPTSLANAEACAEEALVLVHQGSGGSNASQVEMRHSRSGALSNRRVGSGGEGGGPSHSPCDQLPLRPLPRRWATLVPGFLKLELVRQVDEPPSTATTTATSSSLSRKTAAEGEASGKGTFWENAPTTLPIHANALITISNLRRLLIQRSFIASIMCGPEDHRDIRSIGEENIGLPFTHPTSQHIPHRRRFYRRHELPASPSEDPTSSKTRSVHYSAAFDNSRHEKAPAHLSPRSQPHEALNLSLDHDADADKASTSKSREASRPKSMSLLAAFGMLQFASSSTSPPSSMAAAAAPAFSSQPPVLPETVSNVLHSHGRSSVRKDYSHSQQTHPHQPHPTSNRHQRQHQHQHHPSAHPALAASCVVGDLFENATLGGGGMHAVVPVIYVSGTRVPDRMPLYQAIRAFSMDVNEQSRQLLADHRFSMTEQNREDRINAFMWRHIHTVHYRLEKATVSAVSSSSTTSFADSPTVLLSPASLFLRGVTSGISGDILAPSSASAPSTPTANVNSSTTTITASSTNTKHSPASSLSAAISCLKRPRRFDEMSNLPTQSTGKSPSSRLLTFLEPFTDFYAISNDYMAPTLFLLRALYGLCEVGNTLDDLIEPFPIIPADHFQSPKLSAKASRQLQDVFCVLAGNLPSWLVQIITTCPFLFPFSVRQNFFYVHNFDRDRTILHLQDSILNGSMDNEMLGGGNGSGGGGGVNAGIGGVGHSSSPLPRLPHYYHSHGAFRLGGFDGGANSATAILESLLMESASQVQRHKITVHRDPKRLLRAAESALNELHDSRSILEIAFEGEVGFGLGPTLEFYTLVSHQLMTASLNLWHGHNYTDEGYIIAPAPGLYPRPLAKNLRSSQSREVRAKFFFLGQLMARSLLDWRQLDLSLSPTLFKWFLYTQSPEEDLVLCSPRVGVTAADLALVDPPFAKHFQSLLKMSRRRQELLEGSKTAMMAAEEEVRAIDMEIDDLYLSFVLPGYQIELCRGGSQIAVTGSNLAEYLHLCANWFLVEGARRQVIALIEGFDSVLPGIRTGKLAALFRPDECEGLFCGSGGFGGLYRDQLALLRTSSPVSSMLSFVTTTKSASSSTSAVAAGWDVDTLMKSCLCDHGYTLQSKAIQYLFEIMSEFDEPRRRLFIQFATGSPRLPIGGFRALKPPLKIVMKREAEERADQHLPSVMTCQNYLKLPNYSTKEIMREKLLYAIYEGQHAFHLS